MSSGIPVWAEPYSPRQVKQGEPNKVQVKGRDTRNPGTGFNEFETVQPRFLNLVFMICPCPTLVNFPSAIQIRSWICNR